MGERTQGSLVEDGGPAFPGDMPTVQANGNKLPFAPGMSLRDWFAGQALAGLLAAQTTEDNRTDLGIGTPRTPISRQTLCSRLAPMSERASTKGRIVTDYVYPPIPVRQFDWCAWLDGQEEEGPRGWGETKEQAVNALLDELCADRCLSPSEQKAQGSRCGCGGSDDYCGCQNVPDDTTLGEWRAAFVQAEGLGQRADANPKNPLSEGRERS